MNLQMKSNQRFSPSQHGKFVYVLLSLIVLSLCNRLSASEWKPGKTHALIIGVLEWESDLTAYPKLNRKDVALRKQLIERGTPPKNITMLLDSKASLTSIWDAIGETLDNVAEDSTLIIYYAGHGWHAEDDFYFANHDVRLGRSNRHTAWSMKKLAAKVAAEFKGKQLILWADCCYSGGMKLIAEALASGKTPCFSLTSAAMENVSTGNWTFTQCILDGLAGSPLIDTNQDGNISLGELQGEVQNAMHHLEGQKSGYYTSDFDSDWIIGPAVGKIQPAPAAKFPIGSYVRANHRYGRVIGMIENPNKSYQVQFYNYSEKVVRRFNESDLTVSTRTPATEHARIQPDCKVEWQGKWYDAKVVKSEADRWWIRYVDYDHSWNEWVGQDRIRLKQR
ncbi:MAG: hypothetical protein GY880_13825 [Planctomycetaceae bacterium]|nr:hypothetical protein [Planctomycetaceae bacterium]